MAKSKEYFEAAKASSISKNVIMEIKSHELLSYMNICKEANNYINRKCSWVVVISLHKPEVFNPLFCVWFL